jgi:hypothetical protein
MGHENHHSIEAEKDARFARDRALIRRIRKAGGYQKWVARSEGTRSAAFPEKVSSLFCMDDRVVETGTNGVYSAGSGILIKDNGKKREAFIAEMRNAGVTEITTHEGCGAVALYAKREGKTPEEAQEDARAWAKELAAELHGGYRGELPVSPEFHIAQVLYYDMTGRFNPGNAPTLFPPGFVVSRKYMPAYDAKAQTEVGIAIAKGDHGYGNRFGLFKDRFAIVVVAENKKQLALGKVEVRKKAGVSVSVDGFIA